jgi:hypothetical protein
VKTTKSTSPFTLFFWVQKQELENQKGLKKPWLSSGYIAIAAILFEAFSSFSKKSARAPANPLSSY